MALIRDFEIPETGLVVPNAYHLIVNVTTEKRLNDIKPPVDSGRPDGYTARDDDDEDQWVYWKKRLCRKNYYGGIFFQRS